MQAKDGLASGTDLEGLLYRQRKHPGCSGAPKRATAGRRRDVEGAGGDSTLVEYRNFTQNPLCGSGWTK